MYEPFENYGSRQSEESFHDYMLRCKAYADVQPPYEYPPSSSTPSVGLLTPETSDGEDNTPQISKAQAYHQNLAPLAVQDQDTIFVQRLNENYRFQCDKIARDIVANTHAHLGSTKTRSRSNHRTFLYELDARGNPAASPGFLAKEQAQRTLEEHRLQNWMFSKLSRRVKLSEESSQGKKKILGVTKAGVSKRTKRNRKKT